jgi:NAD(P)-dependent dehydrogenase (short-subunit alcohol dehydrogenase family)
MLNIDLSGKTALVTGGSSGIGLACAHLFLQAGAAVAICGRDRDRLGSAVDELRQRHPGAKLIAEPADVLSAADMQRLADGTAATFGGIDMLINNAGQGRISTFETTSDEAWAEELELKFHSLLRPTRACLPWLQRSPQAAVVCVNSLLALQPEPQMVATSAARAGALNLVRSMATEFAPKGVRVNAILIGLVESGQWRRRFDAREDKSLDWAAWTAELATRKGIPLKRLGRPEEAAQAIFFLATPQSSYTTGSHVDVSGGHARHI